MNYIKTLSSVVLFTLLVSCAPATVNTVEASIDSAALTALTSQKVILKHPCTDTVTTLCADQELLKKTKGARLIMINALRGYWLSVDAYKKALKEGGDTATAQATKDAAFAALQASISGAQTLLAEPAVISILSISNSTEN